MIRKRHYTFAQGATAKNASSRCITHERPIGDGNAQELPTCSAWRSQSLRNVWRKVRSHPPLFLANGPLFEELRRSLQDSSGEPPQMAGPVSTRLRLFPRRCWRDFLPAQDLARR